MLITKIQPQSDFFYRQICVLQKIFCIFNLQVDYVIIRRFPEIAAEDAYDL